MISIFSAHKRILIGQHKPSAKGKRVIFSNKKKLRTHYLLFIADKKRKVLLIETNNETKTLNTFASLFTTIEAAGGIVKNNKGQTLMIYRHNRWDLPKGKLEKNELPEKGALREVEEECGIGNLHITSHHSNTLHTYQMNGLHMLKKTYWYNMQYKGKKQKLTPQTEENITQARWMNKQQLNKALRNTYPLIRALLA